MPNLDDKGFNPRNWLFGLLQTIAGIFLMGLYYSNIQQNKDQTEINANVTKLLYSLQSQIDKQSWEGGKLNKEQDQFRTDLKDLTKRVDALERTNTHNNR